MKEAPSVVWNRRAIQIISVIGVGLTIWLAYWVYKSGFFEGDALPFQHLLMRLGIYGPLLFIAIQVIQVIYPVIPGGITCVVGHVVFGPWYGFLFNFIGITIGSVINFHLARSFGKTFVQAFVNEQTYDKYITWLDKKNRFTKLLATAFILPGFPDDFLCMVAGLTEMSFKRFMVIFMVSKPVTLYVYTVAMAEGIRYIFLHLPF